MIPDSKIKYLSECKKRFNESNLNIKKQIDKVNECKCFLDKAKESKDIINIGKYKIKLSEEKSKLAGWKYKNKNDKSLLMGAIKDCESSIPQRTLPSLSSSGMGRYDCLPGMRSKVTSKRAEYFLVQPNDDD